MQWTGPAIRHEHEGTWIMATLDGHLSDEVGHLRDLMHLPSLEQIFRQLAKQEDVGAAARELVAVMREA